MGLVVVIPFLFHSATVAPLRRGGHVVAIPLAPGVSSTNQAPQTAAQKQNRRKKVRAVMASGLVLGVGAAVTLAAWSDTVWGAGTFGTENTSFNIDGSFDGGTTWAAHVASDGMGIDGPGAMTFAQNANSLIPNQAASQLVGPQETEGNLGADAALTRTNADTSPLAKYVTVGVADAGTDGTAPATTFTEEATIGAAAGPMLDTTIAAGGHRWVLLLRHPRRWPP